MRASRYGKNSWVASVKVLQNELRPKIADQQIEQHRHLDPSLARFPKLSFPLGTFPAPMLEHDVSSCRTSLSSRSCKRRILALAKHALCLPMVPLFPGKPYPQFIYIPAG